MVRGGGDLGQPRHVCRRIDDEMEIGAAHQEPAQAIQHGVGHDRRSDENSGKPGGRHGLGFIKGGAGGAERAGCRQLARDDRTLVRLGMGPERYAGGGRVPRP